MKKLTAGQIRKFRASVYGYYRSHGRHDMVWRHAITPYRVLVSEIMLQQTQVDRVTPKFQAFMKRFPTIEALAAAPKRDVLAAWQGLGYNRRALALQSCAQRVIADCRGKIPSDPQILRTLPGIGPATAASIAAFAYNRPVVFLETNVRSVYIHTFFPAAASVDDGALMLLVEQTLDRSSPRRWYYALMDYGAMLKKMNPNPSRRSAQYARQSRFEGSDRQVRGALLRILLRQRRVTFLQAQRLSACESERLEKILSGLVKDGLITRTHNRISHSTDVYAII